jgi:gluconolactonase
MAFDAEGSLYCAVYGQKEIAVVASSGRVLPAIPTDGDRPTNVAFSLTEPLLFVTEAQRGCIEEVPMSVSGLPLHRPTVGR